MPAPISLDELPHRIGELYRPAPRGHWQRRVQTLLAEWLGRPDVRLCWDGEHDGEVGARYPLPGRTIPPTCVCAARPLDREALAVFRHLAPHLARAAQLMEELTAPPTQPLPPRWRQRLTARQAEVALLAAGGLRDREIAEQLGVKPRTVARVLQDAFRRFDVHSRHELAAELALGRPATPVDVLRPRTLPPGDD